MFIHLQSLKILPGLSLVIDMRLIDADALKDAIMQEVYKDQVGVFVARRIFKLIDNAPTVELTELCKGCQYLKDCETCDKNERPQGEWIPVNNRLPKQGNQSYLVTVDYGNGVVCSCQRFFFNEDIGWNDDCVIAWQPLPEPYMRGGAE